MNRFVIACEEYSAKDAAAEFKELKTFFLEALQNTKISLSLVLYLVKDLSAN